MRKANDVVITGLNECLRKGIPAKGATDITRWRQNKEVRKSLQEKLPSFSRFGTRGKVQLNLRDRSLITSRGGGGAAVVLEGGYNFKTSPFLGCKFFTGKKHERGQILWHSNSSLGNLTSVIYPRFHLQVYVYQISKSKNDNNFIHRHKQLNFNILNNVKWDKLTSIRARTSS